MTDREEEADQNITDADEEHCNSEQESAKKPKAPKGNKTKEKKTSSTKLARSVKSPKKNKLKVSKTEKTSKKNDKLNSKKLVNHQSDEDTEQSESDDTGAEKKDELQHAAQCSTNSKSKCDKPKAKATTETSAGVNSSVTVPVKDVYTFELSPAEVPSTSTRFVLSSSQENKARLEGNKAEPSEKSHSDASTPVSCASTAAVSAPTMVPVKSSFSPNSLANGQTHHERTAFEPLRPDAYSHYESPYGPNASLSSLSQLSQSIGGGAGPIMLNHHQPSGNKCQINIKEEPKEEAQASFRSLPHPKALLNRTPPPVGGEHHASSQNFGANFVSSINKNVHPRRLWSNASAGSLLSSSSSSSSSPVQLAFGQCPPGPPTPATPASLASYFTPSNSLPVMAPSLYPPTSQELIRREFDSRILASAVNDRNLLSTSLGIPPPAGSLAPIATHTPFNHAPTSPMIPTTNSTSSLFIPSSASALMPPNPSLYPISASLNSTAFMPGITNLGMAPVSSQAQPQEASASVESSVVTTDSKSSSTKVDPILAKVEKGTWSSMHIRIALDIYQKQKERVNEQQHSRSATNSVSNTSRASSSNSHSKPIKSSSSSSRVSEPPAPVNQSSASSKSSSSTKNSHESIRNTPPNSVRPSSATTFNANYPPRYSTPFGTPSISAPPILPGLFPPSISSPMHLPGFLPDVWPRPPLPGSMPAPPISSANRAPFMLPEYYGSVNSAASAALSAWAAGIRPPSDSFTTPSNKHPTENIKPTTSSSHKRKHDDHESHSKERAHLSKHASSSSTLYQNGDIRHEQSSKKSHGSSSHKHHKSDSGSSSSNSSRNMLENGERSRAESHNDLMVKSKASHHHEPKHDSRHSTFSMANTSSVPLPPVPSPSTFPGPSLFGSSHPSFAPPTPSEHQRYMDLLSMASSMPPTNSFLTSRNSMDLSSRPLWPFGLPPPPAVSSASMLGSASSMMMPDPFKSLQDISLRPGLVTPDRENLFARYSLLNSSGGGASIFDKLSKEQLEKYEMLQGQGKQSQPNSGASSSKPPHTLPDPSMQSSSRSTPTHRVPLPPPPSTSLPPTVPTSSSNPFPYPSPYLNPLNHFSSPGSSYFSQSLGHPSFAPGNPMLNGVDPLSNLALRHPSTIPFASGLPNDCPPSSQFMLPPHYPPSHSGQNMLNFLKGNPTNPYNSTR